LAYSDLDLDEGLYSGLEATGMMRAVPDISSVTAATTEAPSTTRAAVRGRLIAKFGSQVTSAQWDHVTLSSSQGPVRISLMDLFAPAQIAAYLHVIEQASTVEALQELSIS
ncbi:MAG TPA: proteasome accessory factor PafA2 family protein, partial [Candidatus Limnocylindria bacterium]|nr:proteasome accessory factor PafA2 family protein [Candidatus Limnocylindria bacterium]